MLIEPKASGKKPQTMIRESLLESKANRPRLPLVTIEGIVIHWTANVKASATAEANRRYFDRPFREIGGKRFEADGRPFRYGSTHYIVDDKEVVLCIPENEVAYHVGDNTPKIKLPVRPNHCLLGIEMCVNGDFHMVLRRTVWLIGDILNRYPHLQEDFFKKIYRHYDITGKLCPHMYLPHTVEGKQYDWAWQTFLELVRSRRNDQLV